MDLSDTGKELVVNELTPRADELKNETYQFALLSNSLLTKLDNDGNGEVYTSISTLQPGSSA